MKRLVAGQTYARWRTSLLWLTSFPPSARRARLVAACIAITATGLLAGAASVAVGSTHPVAYCSIPAGSDTWAFHAGAPISRATGSYAHGHGSLAGDTAHGIACQVDRVASAPDRQIIVSVGPHVIRHQHAAVIGGQTGNILIMAIRVKSSTDRKCKVGTHGKLTLFATYNGIHKDSVRFSFPSACRRHRHFYSGSNVTVLVPA